MSVEPSFIHSLFQLVAIDNSLFENYSFVVFSAYTFLRIIMAAAPNPFMARAIQLSLENVRSGCGGPFGAVIVRNGEIIAEGVNQVTSRNDPTAHAEVLAIRQACAKFATFELKDCELYSSCEPCPMCLGAIYWARLARLYYANTAEDAAKIGFDDSLIYREIQAAHAHRRVPTVQLMRDQGLAAFRAWADKPDKIAY